MRRRSFLKGLCLSPLAFLKKKPHVVLHNEPKFKFIERTDYYDDRTGAKLPEPQKWMQITTSCPATSCTCEYWINDDKGKLVGCYFELPEDQMEYPFISRDDGTIVANLENYAIIPIKTWEKLTGKKFG